MHVQIFDVLPPKVYTVMESLRGGDLLIALQAPLGAPAFY